MKKLKAFLLALVLCVGALGVVACKDDEEVATVSSVSANNVSQYYYLTSEIDWDAITLTVKYSDNSKKTLTKGEFDVNMSDVATDTEFVVYTDGLHAQTNPMTVGEYDLTCKLVGSDTSYSLLTVTVNTNMSLVYDMWDFTKPANIAKYESCEKSSTEEAKFYEVKTGYVVGNDNGFSIIPEYTLALKGEDEALEQKPMIDLNVKVYLLGDGDSATLLNDDTHYTYSNGKIYFTDSELTEGKSYRIEISPKDFEEDDLGNPIQSVKFEVTVEDGYNVYNALDLGVINLTTEDFDSGVDTAARNAKRDTWQRGFAPNVFWDSATQGYKNCKIDELWESFLTSKGYTNLHSVNGVFLHSDITITTDDIPVDYILTEDEAPVGSYAYKTLRDGSYLYQHFMEDDFTFNGNYFTINATQIPVSLSDNNEDPLEIYQNAGNVDFFGHSTLFSFAGLKNKTSTTTTKILNLNSVGNTGGYIAKDSEDEESVKAAGGLIYMRANRSGAVEIDNCISKNFMIAWYTEVNVKGHIETAKDSGEFVDVDQAFNLNHVKTYDTFNSSLYTWGSSAGVHITKSEFKRFGGPIMMIICDTTGSNYACANGAYNNEIDDETIIDNPVAGQEAWFTLSGASAKIAEITQFNALFVPRGITFMDADGKMNLITLSMDQEYLKSQAKTIWSDIKIGNFKFENDSATAQYVRSQNDGKGTAFFMTDTGFMGYFDGTNIVELSTQQYAGAITGHYLQIIAPLGATTICVTLELKPVQA